MLHSNQKFKNGSRNWLEQQRSLRTGWSSRIFGSIWKLCSLVVTLLNSFHKKQNDSQTLISLGSRLCREHTRTTMWSRVVWVSHMLYGKAEDVLLKNQVFCIFYKFWSIRFRIYRIFRRHVTKLTIKLKNVFLYGNVLFVNLQVMILSLSYFHIS